MKATKQGLGETSYVEPVGIENGSPTYTCEIYIAITSTAEGYSPFFFQKLSYI
jgi:hypothetical protein